MENAHATTRPARRQGSHWKQDPDAVKADILRAATAEIAAHGLNGARIDQIAARTRTSKRMIYYYFGDKEGLYRHVLEAAYREVREGEDSLELDRSDPMAALRKLVGFTFDHHRAHPDFIRLVMIENIQDGQHLGRSALLQSMNRTAIDRLAAIYRKGVAAGAFRKGIHPVELHWQISALCFFNVSNQASFSLIFGDSLFKPRGQQRLRDQTIESVLRFVANANQTPDPESKPSS